MIYLTRTYNDLKRKWNVHREGKLELSEIESTDQFMRSITGDKRWKFAYLHASGAFSTIVLPPNDPAAYATMYALSKLKGCKISQEEFDPMFGAHSGRSKLHIRSHKGYIEATGWLTPLTTRLPEEKKHLTSTFKGLPVLNNIEIRVIGNIDFMKEHHAELQSSYSSALALAQTNNLDANSIFTAKLKDSSGRRLNAV